MSILQILGERLCRLDIALLRGLVTSCEKDDKFGAAAREVDAVAGS